MRYSPCWTTTAPTLALLTLLLSPHTAQASALDGSMRLGLGAGADVPSHSGIFEVAPRGDLTLPVGDSLRLGVGLELRTASFQSFGALAGPAMVLHIDEELALTANLDLGGSTRYAGSPGGLTAGGTLAFGLRNDDSGFAPSTMIYVSGHHSLERGGGDEVTAGLELGGGLIDMLLRFGSGG